MEPRLLPENAAQIAVNVKLYSGGLHSWLKATTVNTPSKGGNIQSCYRIYSTGTIAITTSTEAWLAWPDDVDVVRGPIAGDTAFKLYFTGDTTTATNAAPGPRKTNLDLATTGGTDFPHDWLEMGVPAPGSAPTVVSTGGTSTVSETRVYIYTYVTSTASWSEEGPPSATGTGTGKVDAGWVIAALSTGTTGKYQFGGGIKRIYRTLTDNAGNTNYQLALDNVPIATTSTSDSTLSANLGMICPSFINGLVGSEFVAPPSDMKGLIALPNGIIAGFSGNILCFCEPYKPWAWPLRYGLATVYPIVSLGVYGQTLIVTTKGFPYAVRGVRPDSMTMSMIEDMHPCVSKRSTVSFSWGVAWASHDGLIIAGVGGVINATDEFMKRLEFDLGSWQSLCFPSTLIGHKYMDAYYGFFTNLGVGGNFIFDKTNPQAVLTFGNNNVQGAWNDPETNNLYLIQNGSINQWDSDPNNIEAYDWKSKTFVTPKPVNFSSIQVEADYSQLHAGAAIAAQQAADLAVNASIIGTGASDTSALTVFSTGAVVAVGNVRKSVDGVKMIICMAAGTSTNAEPTYSGTIGGTSTDGPAVKWVRIWDQQGVTKGSLRGVVLRDHIQYSTSDPAYDGSAGYQWGFPLRSSLLVGGTYTNFDARSLLLQVYANIDNSTTATGENTVLVNSQYLTSRAPVRLPKGFKSDTWEFRFSGNIPVRYFKVAETIAELATTQFTLARTPMPIQS
jgi:hypothetical protein